MNKEHLSIFFSYQIQRFVWLTMGCPTRGFPKNEDFLPSQIISGWWLNRPSEKYARQIGSFPQIGMKIKNIWNHQPDMGPTKWFLTAKKQPKMMGFLTEVSTNPTISTKVSMVFSNGTITPI